MAALDEDALTLIASRTVEQVLAPGEVWCREGDRGDSMFIVTKGSVHVIKEIDDQEVVLDVLGGGDIVGEMALLTGARRNATIRAATSVTIGRIDATAFDNLLDSHPEIGSQIWDAFALRQFDLLVRNESIHADMDRDARVRWIAGRPQQRVSPGDAPDAGDAAQVLLILGTLKSGDTVQTAPKLIPAAEAGPAQQWSRVVLLPDLSGV